MTPGAPIRIHGGPERVTERLGDAMRHRGLLRFLVWRDLKVRYRQTALGVAWAVFQPVMLMVLFTLFFGRMVPVPASGAPYALYVYAAVLPWTYFSTAVTESANSLVTNPDLITKVYLPRLMLPWGAAVATLVDFGIGAVLLVVLLPAFGVVPTLRLLLVVPLVLLLLLQALAVGTWLSALNVKYRDVRYVLPFLIQLWLFATPVIYPASFVPPHLRPVVLLNPLAGTVEGFRSALLGLPVDVTALLVSGVMSVLGLVLAVRYFVLVERDFADIV